MKFKILDDNSIKKIRSGFNVLIKKRHVEEFPIHVQLEPTTACNMACITCSREAMIARPQHMKFEEYKRVIDQIRPLNLTLSGFGEPFINPRLPEMIRYAKDNGALINTTSNMTLISEKNAEAIVDCGLDLLKISIDAAEPETYKKIRGEDFHKKIINGIKALAVIKQKKGVNHPAVRFNFVVQKENFREMSRLVKLAHELGVEAIYFQPLEIIDIEERKDDIVGDMAKDDLLFEFKVANNEAVKVGLGTNLPQLIGNFDSFWKKYLEVGIQQDKKICALPWFSIYITVTGEVLPCCSFSTTPEGTMGNIFKDDFKNIWNSEKYKKFRADIRAGKRPYKICQNCVPKTLWDVMKSSRILPGFIK